jgi:hypothetical protein
LKQQQLKGDIMSGNELAFLIVSVGAIILFGGALAYASWSENRARQRP